MRRGDATSEPKVNAWLDLPGEYEGQSMIDYWNNWIGSDVGYVNGQQGYIPMTTYGPNPEVQYEGGCCVITKNNTTQQIRVTDNDTTLSPTGYVQDYINALELVSNLEVKIIGHYDTFEEAEEALLPYLPT